MAFPPQFLDEIRDRVPLAGIVGRRVKLSRAGREHKGLCPFHNEKTPSFTLNEDKGFFHCFGCGAHGDVIGFLMRTENLGFPEAVERLAGEAGLEIPRASPEAREREIRARDLHGVMEAACAWFEGNLRGAGGRTGLEWLRGRAIDDATIAGFRLGWAPDRRDGVRIALMEQGIPEDRLLEAGLISRPDDGRPTYDRFRDRVIFPIADRRGRVVGFGGRAMTDRGPKYLNSPETPVFHKGRLLYALDRAGAAAREAGTVIVVEGYTDVIALHRAGFGTAVAPLGTALTEAQIELLWRLAPEPVLCFDGDNAGRRAAARAAERVLPLLKPGHSLRFAFLPDGEDPDSLVRKSGAAAFGAILGRARPLVDLLWEMETVGHPADTPERRAGIREALRRRVLEIAERTVQESYRDEFEARFARAWGRVPAPGPGGYGRGHGGGGGWSRRPVEIPDSGLRTDGDTGILALRQQQLLLATAINHPDLLEAHVEDLAGIGLAAPGPDRLRQALVEVWTPGLDSEALKGHLTGQGFAAELDRILSSEVYDHGPFACPDSDAAVTERGWTQLVLLMRGAGHHATETARAIRALAEEPTERNRARLDALGKERLRALEADCGEDDEGGDTTGRIQRDLDR